jgi:hypothetical protein
VIGKIIKWMEKVYLFGQMGVAMMENIKMIKNMELVYLHGNFLFKKYLFLELFVGYILNSKFTIIFK